MKRTPHQRSPRRWIANFGHRPDISKPTQNVGPVSSDLPQPTAVAKEAGKKPTVSPPKAKQTGVLGKSKGKAPVKRKEPNVFATPSSGRIKLKRSKLSAWPCQGLPTNGLNRALDLAQERVYMECVCFPTEWHEYPLFGHEKGNACGQEAYCARRVRHSQPRQDDPETQYVPWIATSRTTN